MTRVLDGLVLVAAVVWWAPSILLAIAMLAADRTRFRLVLAAVTVLNALGWHDAARRVCEATLARCDRRRRALSGWRG